MQTLLPTTVVGSYPQPDWLVDRDALRTHGVPRTHAPDIWRVAEPAAGTGAGRRHRPRDPRHGTRRHRHRHRRRDPPRKLLQPLRPRAGRHRRRSTRRGAAPLAAPHRSRALSARSAGAARWRCATSSSCAPTPAAPAKITLPGPFTLSQQAKNDFYADDEELAMDYAVAVNAEVRDLKAAGVDVVQLDEPWVRAAPGRGRALRRPGDQPGAGRDRRPDRRAFLLRLRRDGADKPSGYAFLPHWPIPSPGRSPSRRRSPSSTSACCAISRARRSCWGCSTSATPTVETAELVAARIRDGAALSRPPSA